MIAVDEDRAKAILIVNYDRRERGPYIVNLERGSVCV